VGALRAATFFHGEIGYITSFRFPGSRDLPVTVMEVCRIGKRQAWFEECHQSKKRRYSGQTIIQKRAFPHKSSEPE